MYISGSILSVQQIDKPTVLLIFVKISNITKEELRSYRLTSMEEPTDEMLQAIMEGVEEAAKKSSENARKALERMKEETFKRIDEYKASLKASNERS